jgi:formiminotetrahydrofolate cyclodeaminase
MRERLGSLQIPARFGSDLAVAKALAIAAQTGTLENVRINLDSIQDAAFKSAVEERLSKCRNLPS